MKFRTEIERLSGAFEISHSDRIVMLGSCFADNIGQLLKRDGFNVVHNPLGPLFNPESVGKVLSRGKRPYTKNDFYTHGSIWHCMDFANRYQASDPERLAEKVNDDYLPLANALDNATKIIITLGTNKVYRLDGSTVGNCHKLPGYLLEEHHLSIEEVEALGKILKDKQVILTLSPVRYPGEGLAKGFLAKATLRVAIDNICRALENCQYFPAFEIVNDDLRDYRFYTSDLRHPSEMAVEYIYEHFADTYFSENTKSLAAENRKQFLRESHRPIISES